jgi:hypothetical protein
MCLVKARTLEFGRWGDRDLRCSASSIVHCHIQDTKPINCNRTTGGFIEGAVCPGGSTGGARDSSLANYLNKLLAQVVAVPETAGFKT